MFVCVQNQGKHTGKWVLGFTSHWHSCAQNNNNKQQQYQTFFLQYIRMEIDTTQVVSLSGFQKLSIPIVLLFSSTYY